MSADFLIFKRKNGKNTVKIIPSMKNGHSHESCSIDVNMSNYKDLALFLDDLRSLWGIPIDKAIEEYQRNRSAGSWPF